jgi:hypothetical protein
LVSHPHDCFTAPTVNKLTIIQAIRIDRQLSLINDHRISNGLTAANDPIPAQARNALCKGGLCHHMLITGASYRHEFFSQTD